MQTLEDWARRWNLPAAALHELHTLYRPDDTDTPGKSEAATSRSVERLSGQYRQRVWRNNNGAATDERTGRLIRFGLGNTSARINTVFKSSDYIGITTITIGPQHVGQRMGIFTALEMKAPGWHLTPGDERGQAQAAFHTMVKAAGGIGQFVTDAGQYVDLLRRWGIIDLGGTPQ